MRSDASLRRLAEMGVDVYMPRVSRRPIDGAPAAPVSSAAATSATRTEVTTPDSGPLQTPGAARVLLFAGSDSKAAAALLKDIARTLAFAQITCARAASTDESAITAAAAIVMFGDGATRAVGALLPAQRQREIGWVVSAEPSQLARDAPAKRALWSELKRMARQLAVAPLGSLAAHGAGDDHRVH